MFLMNTVGLAFGLGNRLGTVGTRRRTTLQVMSRVFHGIYLLDAVMARIMCHAPRCRF